LSKYQEKAAILAEKRSFGLMKDRIEGPKLKTPLHLIDIKGSRSWPEIKEQKTGLKDR